MLVLLVFFFFFKQKTAYEMRISDWSSDVCSSDLIFDGVRVPHRNILGEVGQGFALGMEWIGKGRYTIPSHAIGIAERALQMAIDQANTPIGRASCRESVCQYV